MGGGGSENESQDLGAGGPPGVARLVDAALGDGGEGLGRTPLGDDAVAALLAARPPTGPGAAGAAIASRLPLGGAGRCLEARGAAAEARAAGTDSGLKSSAKEDIVARVTRILRDAPGEPLEPYAARWAWQQLRRPSTAFWCMCAVLEPLHEAAGGEEHVPGLLKAITLLDWLVYRLLEPGAEPFEVPALLPARAHVVDLAVSYPQSNPDAQLVRSAAATLHDRLVDLGRREAAASAAEPCAVHPQLALYAADDPLSGNLDRENRPAVGTCCDSVVLDTPMMGPVNMPRRAGLRPPNLYAKLAIPTRCTPLALSPARLLVPTATKGGSPLNSPLRPGASPKRTSPLGVLRPRDLKHKFTQ